ncbi:citrate lyase subunit gamma [Spiroplasma chinense]|uniref:Citrate lyase subunit gamma n=1 Tax=Spiroplasma chinense TaxID=216932 RepID=A0A5B9Y5X4_9MOLU|nr:citrate lyase acyl carrier protein [Spiroplasma chinense]QEH61432.1 citrate lyase subunit gamma [Spiroplasma chinense]
MEKIVVGSVESGDLMMSISESSAGHNEIVIDSKFIQQYGDEIKEIISNICNEYNVNNAKIEVNDQGAIPAVIRARTKTGLERFLNK